MKRVLLAVLAASVVTASFAVAQVVPQPGPPTPIAGAYNTTPPTLSDGQAGWVQLDASGNLLVSNSASSAGGITSVVSAAAEGSNVLKATPGNLYGVYVTSGATAGYLMIFNATSAPADGAVTPVHCVVVPANSTVSISNGDIPGIFSTGITAVFSTTGCFSKTVSATAFFNGRVK